MTPCTCRQPNCKKCVAAKLKETRRAERQAEAKAKLDALKRKAASSCFCYVE